MMALATCVHRTEALGPRPCFTVPQLTSLFTLHFLFPLVTVSGRTPLAADEKDQDQDHQGGGTAVFWSGGASAVLQEKRDKEKRG